MYRRFHAARLPGGGRGIRLTVLPTCDIVWTLHDIDMSEPNLLPQLLITYMNTFFKFKIVYSDSHYRYFFLLELRLTQKEDSNYVRRRSFLL